jgi:NADPH-dependent 2,4-dienoyl-CoA reductase/sulfur reductase-like enzyme
VTSLDRVVIAGGSLAGWTAARSLRRHGFGGDIVLIGAEAGSPYSRPVLSKQFLLDPGKQAADVHLPVSLDLAVRAMPGREATGLDLGRREVILHDGARIGFGGLVIATGAAPRRLPRLQRDGVHLLRTLPDAEALRAAMARGPRVVVIGAGFIGCEVAAAARQRGLDVTLVDSEPLPLQRALGPAAAVAVRDLHAAQGVRLRLGTTVDRLLGTGRAEAVQLATGETLPADLVVVGVGVAPATGWLRESGLLLDGGVVCDAYCRAVGADRVVAAGDVARWHNPLFGELMRVEHWSNASAQADAAARALLAPGTAPPYAHAPYFWSEQYGMRLQFVGKRPDRDAGRLVRGDVSGPSFVIGYEEHGRLVGALAVNRPRECRALRDLVLRGAPFASVLSDAA